MTGSGTCEPVSAGLTLKAGSLAFQTPTWREGLWQIATSLPPLIGIVVLMHYLLAAGTWWGAVLLAPCAVLGAGFVVRIFIIQHDCGHGSFFASKLANDVTGFLCGVVTFTPYANWARQHAGHHATWNNLDRRHTGADIYSTCVTVAEFNAMTPRSRLVLRLVRTPIVYLGLIPPLVFLVLYRLPFDSPREWKRERLGVHLNNLMMLVAFVAMGVLLGFSNVLIVQLPIIAIAAITGVFLFSVQHRFETTLWSRSHAWNSIDAALKGSSYLDLTPILRWFTGNIGYHHIHHLNSRVPNYRLRAAHDALTAADPVPAVTLGMALRNHRHALWDEDRQRMVSFGEARRAAGRT